MNTAMVILGAPNDSEGNLSVIALSRCEAALTEFIKRPTLKVICTGGVGAHFNTTSIAHGQYLKRYLLSRGIPEVNFCPIVESRFTFEDATLSQNIIEAHGITSVVLVTSDFHLSRAKLVFTGVYPTMRFRYIVAITPLSEEQLLELEKHELLVMQRERGNLLNLIR
ncbi:YdcF family protein [Shewanella sp. D64]|uniref:YdcF family protein n=1 Tax=unclassified Shewanella TaxID=196818 RepID=UPI0022BA1325|nr:MULTISPECIES: YdcF family protein [unclassified Shewanella]MEC4725691.1 YdcF family protein [Shewanella sp. D64]MEC4737702.1 YdcF family protein [Shewanella sp. E94]WBJ93509.1 YdcF family protein [Shewanella sp. MTB7]